MGVSDDETKPKVSEPTNTQAESDMNPERRAALKKIGAYSAYVAPAMLVLMTPDSEAEARHRRGGGRGRGRGRGRHGRGPNCDNPGLHLGFNRNGHSAC